MNLSHWLKQGAKKYFNNIAIVSGKESVTYAELNERVNRLANAFLKMGLSRGDRVGHLENNCPQCLEVDFAIYRCGLIKVSMNPKLNSREYQYLLNNSNAIALVYGEEFADRIEEIRPQSPSVKYLIQVKGEKKGILNYDELLRSSSPLDPEIPINVDDVATLQYTSGTSGETKGAMLSQRSWMASATYFMLEAEEPYTEKDVVLHVAPITHGSQMFMFASIYKGGMNVALRGFETEEFLETIQRYRVTRVFLVPTLIRTLVEFPHLGRYDLRSLKDVYYAAAPIDKYTLKKAMEKMGTVFTQFYGLSEATGPLTYLSRKEHVFEGKTKDFERLDSAGRTISYVDLKIVNENCEEVKAGESGEILVKSEHMMKGYWQDKTKTDETLIDGWLHTGDIGRMDPEGYLFIMDRKTDMLISGGFNIYPKEIENVLYTHPAVLEAAVIGIPDQKWGEAVHAEVVLKKGTTVTEEEIIEHCKRNLASFKKPKSVHFVEALPKNSYGKIQKNVLKDQYWKGLSRRVH